MRPPRPFWESWEDDAIRDTYPDYAKMSERLPHRNYRSLRYRAGRLCVVSTRHHWSPAERKRLKEAFRASSTNEELLTLFPGMSLSQIRGMAVYIKAPRRHILVAQMDDPALASIRGKVRALGITYRRLDEMAGTGKYFGATPQRPVLKHIVKAIKALGGAAEIVWSE